MSSRFTGIIIIATVLLPLGLAAQKLDPSVICASSGFITNGQTNINWTLGETVIATMGSANALVSNGFEQSGFAVTAVKNDMTAWNIQLYPNPTNKLLSIHIQNKIGSLASYELFDSLGKLISEGQILREITDVDCSQLMSAFYYLRIKDAYGNAMQTYKIMKL